jgi:hypothetical protein
MLKNNINEEFNSVFKITYRIFTRLIKKFMSTTKKRLIKDKQLR